MNYISLEKKLIVGRNNNPVPPLTVDYDTLEQVDFTFVNKNNQLQPAPSGNLYFAGSLKMGELPSSILFYSDEATISGTALSFLVDTYTAPYIEQIKKKYTEINIEIGQTVDGMKHVLLRDVAFASPRVYVEGVAPSSAVDLATKQWVLEQGFIPADGAEEIISGYVMQAVSGLNIPTKTSDLLNDSGFVNTDYVAAAVSGKQDKITSSNKLAYSLLSGTPSIPTKTSDLTNDSGYATSSYVQAQVSGKQDKIDSTHKLAYSLLSGTPSIPTKTSDLTNDSGYATSSYVQAQVSGKQDAITNAHKLAYSLLSGTPTIPTKTSDLTNDSSFVTSSYVDSAVSGKQDTLTFDNTPLSSSLNPVTSQGIWNALQSIQPGGGGQPYIDVTVVPSSASSLSVEPSKVYCCITGPAQYLYLTMTMPSNQWADPPILIFPNFNSDAEIDGNMTIVDSIEAGKTNICQVLNYEANGVWVRRLYKIDAF